MIETSARRRAAVVLAGLAALAAALLVATPALAAEPPHSVGVHDAGDGSWAFLQADGSLDRIIYGDPLDAPFMGDWDCDGTDTPGLFRESDAHVYLRNSRSSGIADIEFAFGDPADVAVPGDFSGDGCDTVALFRPSLGRFFVKLRHVAVFGQGPADRIVEITGAAGTPLAGDFDGDGVDTFGTHDAATGVVRLSNDPNGGEPDVTYTFGNPGDVAVVGDWDGDGRDSIGVFRPATATFYLRNATSPGIADAVHQFAAGNWSPLSWSLRPRSPSSLTATVAADPATVPEPGGPVTYTTTVTNTSPVDAITLDQVAGDPAADVCAATVLAPAATTTCTTGDTVGGGPGTVTTTVTVTATDDDAQPLTATADATVTIGDVPSSLTVAVGADPATVPEPGGPVTYTTTVTNTSPADTITLDQVAGDPAADRCAAIALTPAATTTCTTGDAVGGGPGTVTTTVTVTATDDDGASLGGTADATVTITDVPSSLTVAVGAEPAAVPEPGGPVTYTTTITNTSPVDTITLDQAGTDAATDVCTATVLTPAATTTCTLDDTVTGQPGAVTTTVTVTATDDDGQPRTATADATVTITDVPSSLTAATTADPAAIPEPGGPVTYTTTVTNTSPADTITLDQAGANAAAAICAATVLAPAATTTCTFDDTVTGQPGAVTTTVKVTASDDDGQPLTGSTEAVATITDVPSSLTAATTADPTAIPEPGGPVTYTTTVTNTSPVDAITLDQVAGNPATDVCTATVLAPAATTTCTTGDAVAGPPGTVTTTTFTVTATDDDGQPLSGGDDVAVTITDVPSSLALATATDPAETPEPGGPVTYTTTVTNTSPADTITLDDVSHGAQTDPAGDVCAATVLAPAATTTCTFADTVTGGPATVTTTVAVAATDDDGASLGGTTDAIATITDVPSALTAAVTAEPVTVPAPDEAVLYTVAVPASGGAVAYTTTVTNTSPTDTVTLDQLTHDGDSHPAADVCDATVLAPAATATCSHTRTVAGAAGAADTAPVTVAGIDDDAQAVAAPGQAKVHFYGERSRDGFTVEPLLTGFSRPTSMAFLPDGRVLITSKGGTITIGDPSTGAFPMPTATYMELVNFVDLPEGGLLDITLDPDFATNGWFYIYYSPDTPAFARVSRFTHQENGGGLSSTGDLASELVVWTDTDTYLTGIHQGASVDFGPQGNLWLSTGDKGSSHLSQDLTSASGKLLRIAPDGSVPPGNPFADGPGGNHDYIFAYGLRNPFRARWDLADGPAPNSRSHGQDRLFLGDVGSNNVVGWEEINVLTVSDAGANLGWPDCEGLDAENNPDFPNCEPHHGPVFAYPHDGSGAAVIGGVVYRSTMFPPEWQGVYFYGDEIRDYIRYLEFDTTGETLIAQQFFLPTPEIPTPASLITTIEIGPDGALYYLRFDHKVERVVYAAGNQPPQVTAFTADPVAGVEPLTVDFDGAATDPEGAAMTYTLSFGDGTPDATGAVPAGGTLPTIQHTYPDPGPYVAQLTVSDGVRTGFSAPLDIAVGTPPVATITSPVDESLFAGGESFTLSGSCSGTPNPCTLTWTVLFGHNEHFHPDLGPVDGNDVVWTAPTGGHDFSETTWFEFTLVVTDAVTGLTGEAVVELRPDKVPLTLAAAEDGTGDPVAGLILKLDGRSRVAPFTIDALRAFEHTVEAPSPQCVAGSGWSFAAWSDGGAQGHTYTVPPGGATLTASYTDTGIC